MLCNKTTIHCYKNTTMSFFDNITIIFTQEFYIFVLKILEL